MAQKGSHILQVDNISKSFAGVAALQFVSFSVNRNNIKALIGPNGAGKTTLLNTISGLVRPDAGRIYLNGGDLVKSSPHDIALSGVARTFQLVRLFTTNRASVLDNVMLGGHNRTRPRVGKFILGVKSKAEAAILEEAHEVLEFLDLIGLEKLSPLALSFGNQRKVELARSLMMRPQLLLLDEPASGLNDAEVGEFADLLLRIKGQGITILIVEHNMDLVMKVADSIVVLDFGKKIAEDIPNNIVKDKKVIAAYLGEEISSAGPTDA
jgi:ABC-type branched-subunit amino acid transport system ATPase component